VFSFSFVERVIAFKRLRAALLFACSSAFSLAAGPENGRIGIMAQPFETRSGPRGNTLFTTLSPEQTNVVTENTYGDAKLWGERFAEFAGLENFNIENQYPIIKQVFSWLTVSRILVKNKLAENRIQQILLDRGTAIHNLPVLSQYSVANLLGYTQNVLLKDMDQMSMANSLEVREPFFDYKLVEYVLQIPDAIKYPVYAKSLLVESFQKFLPDEIVHRKKMGFIFPWNDWLRGELRDYALMHLQLLGGRKQFNKQEIDILWQAFLGGKGGVKWIHIWQLVVLSVYLSTNFDA